MSYRTTYWDSEKQKRVTVRGKSKKECEKKIREKQEQIRLGKDIYSNSTFGYWADRWFVEQKLPSGLSEGTLVQYKSAIKHLNSRFECKELSKIRLSDFQALINDLAKNNPFTNKPSSKATLENVKKVAQAIFRYASANGIPGVTDFFSCVKISKEAPKGRREALSIEQINMIVDTPSRIQPLAMIMLFCGLRRGEAIPLRWSDIDFNKGTISVNHSIKFEHNQPIEKQGGKTESATRVIPMPPILQNYLESMKNQKVISPYVCPSRSGRIYTETSFKKDWNLYLYQLNAKYGYDKTDLSNTKLVELSESGKLPMRIEPFTSHCLRHTYSTLLYLQDIDVVTAMQYLGHSNIQVTVNIYTDLKKYYKFDLPDDFKEKLNSEYKVKSA